MKPSSFSCLAGHFEPTGPCSRCQSREGWDQLGAMCPDCFRIYELEPRQFELGQLWGLHEAVQVLGKLPPSDQDRTPLQAPPFSPSEGFNTCSLRNVSRGLVQGCESLGESHSDRPQGGSSPRSQQVLRQDSKHGAGRIHSKEI